LKEKKLVSEKLQENSIEQYKLEERSIVSKRILSSEDRLNELVSCMKNDVISLPENVKTLKQQVYGFTRDVSFKKSKNMGEILENALNFLRRNYEGVTTT